VLVFPQLAEPAEVSLGHLVITVRWLVTQPRRQSVIAVSRAWTTTEAVDVHLNASRNGLDHAQPPATVNRSVVTTAASPRF